MLSYKKVKSKKQIRKLFEFGVDNVPFSNIWEVPLGRCLIKIVKLKTGRDLKINPFCYLKAVFSAEPPVDSDFLYVTK